MENQLPPVPPAIAEYVFIRQGGESEPALYIAENYRNSLQIQTFARQVCETAPGISPSFIPLDELHALNRREQAVSTGDYSAPQHRVIRLFQTAVARGASDIHMAIGDRGTTLIRMRIHGELFKVDSMTTEEGKTLASTIILSMCDVTETQFVANRPQDGRIKAEFLAGTGLFGARYAHTPTVSGLHVVMRLIKDDSQNPPTLDQLGFLPEQRQQIEQLLTTPEGMVILSGPTGSGKSTTLRTAASMYLDTHDHKLNLVTYEDPPEGYIVGAVQCPIVADKSDPDAVLRAWRLYLSNTLRIDPDAIMVGEMRDAFSASACVTDAMTGHIVLTTLHANDPINILERLLTLDIRPELLADPQLFIGLISQRLVQVLCSHCRIPWKEGLSLLPESLREEISHNCDTDNVYLRNHDGCPSCQGGVSGRSVVAEIIRPDATFMTLLRNEGKLAARDYWITQLGGITRNQHVLTLVHQGRVDPRAAMRVCPLDEDTRLARRSYDT